MLNANRKGGIRFEKPAPSYLAELLHHKIKIGYVLKNIKINQKPNSNATITASLYIFGFSSNNSYLDDRIQKYCSKLAIFLRDKTDYNQFFDIDKGKFKLFC